MVDLALFWVGVAGLCGLLCLAGALKGYAETGTPNYWGIAGTSIAASGVVELLLTTDYVGETELVGVISVQLLLLGGVFTVVAYREHGVDG